MTSTEGDLTALKDNWSDGGLSWDDFGRCTQNQLDGLNALWFPSDVVNQIKVQGIWARHHDRQQGKFNSLISCHSLNFLMAFYYDFILMRFSFCFFCG